MAKLLFPVQKNDMFTSSLNDKIYAQNLKIFKIFSVDLKNRVSFII